MTEPRHTLALTLLLSGTLAACASSLKTQPSDVVHQAAQILQRASQQHVDDYASPELKLARAKCAAAQKAMLESKPELATALAQESIASARLASIQAAGARATANKLSVQRQVDEMQQLAHPSAAQPDARDSPGGNQ